MKTPYPDGHGSPTVGLLGPSFDTGNMGVNALAESSIKCLLARWPNAKVILLAGGRDPSEYTITVLDKTIRVRTLPIRYCKNIFRSDHFLTLLWYGILLRLVPSRWLRQKVAARNASVAQMLAVDLVADITAGDSFSDIYGLPRFLWVFSLKWLVLLFRKDLVMLPQTYGPYNKRITKILARYVLRHARILYARDVESAEFVRHRLGKDAARDKVRFVPDVAFVLDPREPEHLQIDPEVPAEGGIDDMPLVGLNVSGLLFNGGYTRSNMFGLKADYRQVVSKIVEILISRNCRILLVPHVYAPVGHVESDPDACRKIFDECRAKYPGRIFLTTGQYDHRELKFIIGRCDFFVGSRMHSCIAAISQGIATVGVAYSKKFLGVFNSVGIGDCVIDARACTEDQVAERITDLFQVRTQIKTILEKRIPDTKREILDLFRGLEF